MRISDLTKNQNDFFLIVGRNGSGKSMLLHELSEEAQWHGFKTIAVSNTLFDKFNIHTENPDFHYIGSKLGRNFPERSIKKTLSSNNETRVSKIFDALDYLDYNSRVGIRITFKRKFSSAVQYGHDHLGNSYPIFYDDSNVIIDDELKSAIDRAFHETKNSHDKVLWLEGTSNVFYEGYFSAYLNILKNEGKLKEANIISKVEIFLSKKGESFPIRNASSGELSFISLLVHLALNTNDGSYIFIDEPENSLHPKWQSEYFNLLKGALGYYKCKVVIATHSPLITSTMADNDDVVVLKNDGDHFIQIKAKDDSAEEVYLDYFDTLTPKNKALSNRCVDILDELTEGKITSEVAKDRVSHFEDLSQDDQQREFLSGVMGLVDDISKKVN